MTVKLKNGEELEMGSLRDFLGKLKGSQDVALYTTEGNSFLYIGTAQRLLLVLDVLDAYFQAGARGRKEKYTHLDNREVMKIKRRHVGGEPEALEICVVGTESGKIWCRSETEKTLEMMRNTLKRYYAG